MTVTRESLKEHFGLISDEELLDEFRSGDLTDLAREVAVAELRARKIDPATATAPSANPDAAPAPEGEAESSGEGDAAPDSEDLVLIGRFASLVDANLLQSRLDAEGVPAIIADAITSQNLPFGSAFIGVRVLVPESYLARAVEIRKEIERGDFALDDKTDVG